MIKFDSRELKKLFRPHGDSKNGQVTIIGGSELFHGAPLLSLKTTSRIVDMVFFSSPEPSIGQVASLLKSKLFSFIWVPWDEVGEYIKKSDAILIGPGLMRYRREKEREKGEGKDEAWALSKNVTEGLLRKFPSKKWVIDAGSLQVMKPEWIPEGAILTPNKKEYNLLFGDMNPAEVSKKRKCTVILKGEVDLVCSYGKCVEIKGGNAGMAKGGTGDVLAGLVTALYAKNEAFLSAKCASHIAKKTGDVLFNKIGTNFNADDLCSYVPEVLVRLQE